MQYLMVVAHWKYSLSRYSNTKCYGDLGPMFNWRNFWAGQLVSFKESPILFAPVFEVRKEYFTLISERLQRIDPCRQKKQQLDTKRLISLRG